jgi:single-stranded-DNA-specific exonuclease
VSLIASRAWQRRQPPEDVVAELENDLRLSHLTARLLALRGIQGATEAQQWLGRKLTDLHRPELMLGMEQAAARLAQAINQRERILIHGDYDVDGSTSASLLALFVRACGWEAIAWIPHRRIDGYGLSEASLQAVQEHRAQVMVTVDCGIADHGFAARIERETGCAVIITDHHLPQGSLPQCTAVCNPNQPDCPYPDKHLAGVGVAWKLAWATAKILSGGEKVTDRLRAFLLDSLSLVAVGTVADCAVLDGENRIMVHHGLHALAKSVNPGLRCLREHCRLEMPINAGDVGWRIGPLLNAAGRVGSAMANIRLLTAITMDEAGAELEKIVAENEERRRITQVLSDHLFAEIAADPSLRQRAGLVFSGEGWHQGVVGIVASRLVEAFGRPVAVIAIQDGLGKGSLRSVAKVHLAEVLDACRPFIIKGGGHAMAAGLSIDPAKIDAFRDAFDQQVASRVTTGDLQPRTDYDGDAAIAELDADFFTSLENMAPFGIGNPEPVLRLDAASFISRPRLFGKTGDHLRGALTDVGGGMREFLAWRAKAHSEAFCRAGSRFELLVKPQAGRWHGELKPQLIFVDGKTL